MSRLIDADALMELIEKTHCTGCNNYNKVRCRACGIGDMLDYLDDAPTVDLWHYPSKGEYPPSGEEVLCLLWGTTPDVGCWNEKDKLWHFDEFEEEDVDCWQYIELPKEEA